MTTTTIRSGVDAFVTSVSPNRNTAAVGWLNLLTSSMRGYVWLPTGAMRRRQIATATLTVYAHGASTGSRTLTLKAVTGEWAASTITWNNQPAFSSTATATATVGDLNDGDAITFDVTADVAAWAAGGQNNGWQLVTSSTTQHSVYSFDDTTHPDWRPTLTVTYSSPPDTPTSLRPHGTIATANPTLSFDYSDIDGDELQAVQVQVDDASDFASVVYDSGSVASTVPEFALTGFALPSGGARYWRVRAQDDSGAWSNWSDPATVTFLDLASASLTVPAAGVFGALAPIVSWSYTGTQTAWHLKVWDTSNGQLAYDSGVRSNSATSCQVAALALDEGVTYRFALRVRDNVADRVTVPGYTGWSTVSATAVFAESSSVAAPPSVEAAQDTTDGGLTLHPRISLTWAYTGSVDWWTVYRNDEVIADLLDASDALVSGSIYGYVDHGAKPGHNYVYSVRAVVGGQSSPKAPSTDITPRIDGIWLYDPADSDNTVAILSGNDVGNVKMADQVTIQSPLGSVQQVRITTGMYGLAGTITGILRENRPGQVRTVADMRHALMRMKADPNKQLRLVYSGLSIPVYVSNVSVSPDVANLATNQRGAVSFDFIQAGEIAFKAVL